MSTPNNVGSQGLIDDEPLLGHRSKSQSATPKILIGLLGLNAVLISAAIGVVAVVGSGVRSDIQDAKNALGSANFNIIDIVSSSFSPQLWHTISVSASTLLSQASTLDFAVVSSEKCKYSVYCNDLYSQADCQSFIGDNKHTCLWDPNFGCYGQGFPQAQKVTETFITGCGFFSNSQDCSNANADIIEGNGCFWNFMYCTDIFNPPTPTPTRVNAVCKASTTITEHQSNQITTYLANYSSVAQSLAVALQNAPNTTTTATLNLGAWIESIVSSDFSLLGKACAGITDAIVTADLSKILCPGNGYDSESNDDCERQAELRAFGAAVGTICTRVQNAHIGGD